MPWMCGKRIKNLRNGFTMLKMIEEIDKRLICMRNTGNCLSYLRNI